jgi:AmmeMemoRadiSam system protein B
MTMKPKLREIEAHAIQHQGQEMVLLRDPLNLSEASIAIPRPLAPLLGLMDGTRNSAELEAAVQVRAGVRLAPDLLPSLLAAMDEALLLDNERFAAAKAAAVRVFRDAPFRALTTIDGSAANGDPGKMAAYLQSFLDALDASVSRQASAGIRGVVSPHIDYQRGGPVYAEVWSAATQATREAELVILLGTDHQGGDGKLTLTRQSYATPWGTLPTEATIVDELAAALGPETAFEEELHHRNEHSIELAAIWLHFIRAAAPVPVVPILCGSFAGFVAGVGDPASHAPFAAAVEVLQGLLEARRTLVVAAADLAHMGPAFGDPYGLDFIGRAQLRSADERLLAAVHAGNAQAFFDSLKAEGDRRHVCGLPPIYLMLRVLGKTQGEPAGYALCPADPQGTSFVSIAGAILT